MATRFLRYPPPSSRVTCLVLGLADEAVEVGVGAVVGGVQRMTRNMVAATKMPKITMIVLMCRSSLIIVA